MKAGATYSALGRILIVDDEPDIRTTVATRLRGAGYDVVEAASGEEAIARVERDPPDLVILDVMMPGMSGFAVLEQLRMHPDMPSIIFLSALGNADTRLRGLYEGAQDFLTKPFDPEEMLARVATAMRLRKLLVRAQVESMLDPLTGLGNRRAFTIALDEEIARHRRYIHPLALILLDADDLKEVNDTLGHAIGDELLKFVARAMRSTARATDGTFRLGGDEFVILLPETGRDTAACVVVRLRQELEVERYGPEDHRSIPSVSFGVAVMPDDARDGDGLVKAADRELYRMKAARGRGRLPPRRNAA